MTGATHMLVGAALGKKFQDPGKVAGLAFSSHFLLDAIPHNDYIYFYLGGNPFSLGMVSGITGIATILILIFVLKGKAWRKIGVWGAFFGVLPDFITNLTYRFGYQDFWFNLLHRGIHTQTDLGEIFYRLSGGVVRHTEEIAQWRANFELLNSSLAAHLGWWLELGLEILFVLLLIRTLRRIP